MKISFVEFDKRVKREWAGRTYYYDSELQREKTGSAPAIRMRFEAVCTMFSPNCVTFRNDAGDSLLFSEVRGVEMEPLTASAIMLTLLPRQEGATAVSIIIR